MDADKRKARLIELRDRMRGGEDVAPRDMKAVLSKPQFAALQDKWAEQQQLRAEARSKPAAIVRYLRGEGVTLDSDAGLMWLHSAAAAGHAIAKEQTESLRRPVTGRP